MTLTNSPSQPVNLSVWRANFPPGQWAASQHPAQWHSDKLITCHYPPPSTLRYSCHFSLLLSQIGQESVWFSPDLVRGIKQTGLFIILLKVSNNAWCNDVWNFPICSVLFGSSESFPWWYQRDNKRWYHHHQLNMWSTSCTANYQDKQISVYTANITIFFILGCLNEVESHCPLSAQSFCPCQQANTNTTKLLFPWFLPKSTSHISLDWEKTFCVDWILFVCPLSG